MIIHHTGIALFDFDSGKNFYATSMAPAAIEPIIAAARQLYEAAGFEPVQTIPGDQRGSHVEEQRYAAGLES